MTERESGWSPFSVKHKTVQSNENRNPNAAIEIFPIIVMGKQRRAQIEQVAPEAKEAEAPAETDPKVSSATSSAEVSVSGFSESGSPVVTAPIHPSTLPPLQDDPVSVEKVQNPAIDLLGLKLKLG